MEDKQILIMQKSDLEKLLEELVSKLEKAPEKRWILEEEAMSMLGVRSKSFMWSLRSTGKLTVSQPSRKILLYDIESIKNLIESNIKKSF